MSPEPIGKNDFDSESFLKPAPGNRGMTFDESQKLREDGPSQRLVFENKKIEHSQGSTDGGLSDLFESATNATDLDVLHEEMDPRQEILLELENTKSEIEKIELELEELKSDKELAEEINDNQIRSEELRDITNRSVILHSNMSKLARNKTLLKSRLENL